MRKASIANVFVALAISTAASTLAQAQVILTDGNSVASFQPATQAGQYSWTIDGQQQMKQQWFWYRIGNTAEQSVDTISAPVISGVTANSFNADYQNASIHVQTAYSLLGGSPGDGNSDLLENIRIDNLTQSALDFHFYEYVDFDLLNTANDLSVAFNNPAPPHRVTQTDVGAALAETVISGVVPTHREVNFYNPASPVDTLNLLNDAFPTTLNDNFGPLGPGDLTWAFEWDYSIPFGGSLLIGKNKNLQVPEPGTIGLLVLGGLMLARKRRSA